MHNFHSVAMIIIHTVVLISRIDVTIRISVIYNVLLQENFYVCILADSGFFKNFLYQGGVKSTVSCVFEDLKFKISEGYDQNWCFPDSAQLAVSV